MATASGGTGSGLVSTGGDRRPGRPAVAIAAALAAIPAVAMAAFVRTGTRVQQGDYWLMIAGFLRPDGWFSRAGLFRWSNEHPVAVAKLLYWANARLFGGSNLALGGIDIVIAAVAVAVVARLAWARFPTIPFIAVTVATSALLFSPQGSWNFWKSMSGAAWLTANALCLIAIAVRLRWGRAPAMVAALLATFSYSTGLLTWPVLLLVGLCRDRTPRREWPVLVGGVLAFTWYATTLSRLDRSPRSSVGVVQTLKDIATVSGSIFSPDDASRARALGFAALVVGGALALVALLVDMRRNAPFIGIYAFAVGTTVEIGLGRNPLFVEFTASRYSSLSALLWLSILALLACLVRFDAVVVVACALALVGASISGGSARDDLRSGQSDQDLLAIAQRIGVTKGAGRWIFYAEPFRSDPAILRALGHYPFDGDFHAACGLLGRRLPTGTVDGHRLVELHEQRDRDGRLIAVAKAGGVPEAVQFRGWTTRPARCVVAVDRSRTVVGASVFGYQPNPDLPGDPPDDQQFTGLAPVDGGPYRVFAVLEG